MPSTTSIAIIAAAASLAGAAPLAPRASNNFHVTDFSYGCSPGGCAWGFNVSGDANGQYHPAYPATACNGTSYSVKQLGDVSCAPISDSQTVYAYLNVSTGELFLEYQYSVPESTALFIYDGNTTVSSTAYTDQPANFDVLESSARALAKRDATNQCASYYSTCMSQTNSESYCGNAQDQCNSCYAAEVSCRDGADYSQQLTCTQQAQQCYFNAQNPGTLNGSYGPDEAFATCKTAPMENNSFCASQLSGFQGCQSQEDSCRTAENANQAYCSSQASQCFTNALL